MKRIGLLLTICLAVCLLISVCGGGSAATKGKLVLVDFSWDSVQVHNRIAEKIINAYGYDCEFVPAESVPGMTGLMNGDIDIAMEVWVDNILELYNKGIDQGDFIDLGSNFPDSEQGWYVPTYMIKGDPGRGIKATAPDLTNVQALAKYWQLFKDPEDPSKGRLYVGPPGWQCTATGQQMLKDLGLDKYYNGFLPGSDSALSASMIAAYKKGEPWVGYYWAPTWVLGLVDMTLLKGSEWPPCRVDICVNSGMLQKAPDVVEFLKKYGTTTAQNNEFLGVMHDQNLTIEQAAEWFLKNNEETWTTWVPDDIAAKVKASLK